MRISSRCWCRRWVHSPPVWPCNAVSLPPLIAQMEFAKDDVQRVVGLTVGVAQGTFAFAPALFGLLREFAPLGSAAGAAAYVFAAAALAQTLAIGAFLAGRSP